MDAALKLSKIRVMHDAVEKKAGSEAAVVGRGGDGGKNSSI